MDGAQAGSHFLHKRPKVQRNTTSGSDCSDKMVKKRRRRRMSTETLHQKDGCKMTHFATSTSNPKEETRAKGEQSSALKKRRIGSSSKSSKAKRGCVMPSSLISKISRPKRMCRSGTDSSEGTIDEALKQVGEMVKRPSPKLEECGICFDVIKERGVLDCCNHMFCFGCIDRWLARSCRCPHCKRVVSKLSSDTCNQVKLIERKELQQTLENEDEDLEENMHDVLDHISFMARSIGMRINFMHRTILEPPSFSPFLLPGAPVYSRAMLHGLGSHNSFVSPLSPRMNSASSLPLLTPPYHTIPGTMNQWSQAVVESLFSYVPNDNSNDNNL